MERKEGGREGGKGGGREGGEWVSKDHPVGAS
jgi:hypothetical protein